MGRALMLGGAVLFMAGLLLHFGGLPLGRLPGDITYQRGNFSFYFPAGTSLLVSLLLTVILWLMRKF